MTEWTPDNEFLDFLVEKMEENSSVGVNTPFLGMPYGTQKGGDGYSMKVLTAEMCEGKEEHWRRMYAKMYGLSRDNFEAYKANKQ